MIQPEPSNITLEGPLSPGQCRLYIVEDTTTDATWKDPERARAFCAVIIREYLKARGLPHHASAVEAGVEEALNTDGWLSMEVLAEYMGTPRFDLQAMMTAYFLIFRS